MTAAAPTIGVVGAGIAGLTLAAALGRAGIACRVFEQARHLGEVGAGLQLAPNAVRLLHRLGLAERLRCHAVRIEATELRWWDDGRVLTRTVLGEDCEQRYGAPYCTVHRAHLQAALLDLVDDSTIHTGHRLRWVGEQAAGVSLHFDHGVREAADVAVGADGIRSVVRGRLAADAPVYSGLAVYRGLVGRSGVPELAAGPRVQVWVAPKQHFVCYPVDGGHQISFAATVPSAERSVESWSVDGAPAELAAAYRGWDPTVTGVIRAATTVKRWPLNDREPLGRWSTGRLTLLGDAAHPMLPFLAQGANQAIEDAVTLAACLAGADTSEYGDALRHYETVRIPRTTAVQRHARSRARPAGARGTGTPDDATRSGAGLDVMAWLYGYDAEAAAGAPSLAVTRGAAGAR